MFNPDRWRVPQHVLSSQVHETNANVDNNQDDPDDRFVITTVLALLSLSHVSFLMNLGTRLGGHTPHSMSHMFDIMDGLFMLRIG